MRTFANKFQIAVNQEVSEISLSFSQVSPIIPENNEPITETNVEDIVDLVMTKQTALELVTILGKMLKEK